MDKPEFNKDSYPTRAVIKEELAKIKEELGEKRFGWMDFMKKADMVHDRLMGVGYDEVDIWYMLNAFQKEAMLEEYDILEDKKSKEKYKVRFERLPEGIKKLLAKWAYKAVESYKADPKDFLGFEHHVWRVTTNEPVPLKYDTNFLRHIASWLAFKIYDEEVDEGLKRYIPLPSGEVADTLTKRTLNSRQINEFRRMRKAELVRGADGKQLDDMGYYNFEEKGWSDNDEVEEIDTADKKEEEDDSQIEFKY